MPSADLNLLLAGERLDAAVLTLLSRVEVRESDSDPSVLALRFTIKQLPTGDLSPIDDPCFEPGAELALELAAPGGLPQRLFQGYVTHVRPHLEPITSNSYLEVLAMDPAVVLDAHERVATYPDSTDADAAAEILGRYNLQLDSEDTPARHEADRMLLVQHGSDWQFLKRLARRNGMRVFFEYDPDQGAMVCSFKKPNIEGEAQADLVILQDDGNLNWVDIQQVMTGPVKSLGVAIDPIAKRLVRGEGEIALGDLGETNVADQIEAALTGAGAEGAVHLMRDPYPLDTAINAASTAATDAARFAIELRGELNPSLYRALLRARRPALIRGVGRRFSGMYYVQSVRTTLADGALTQSFVAVRNATGQTGAEDFGQSAEEVPPQ